MIETLVDRIYEAAFQPEIWPDVLDDICQFSQSASACVLHFSAHASPTFVSTELTGPVVEAFCANDDWKNFDRSPHAIAQSKGRFICDADYLTPDWRDRDPVANRLKAVGLGWQQGTPLGLTPDAGLCFSVERRLSDGRHDPASIARLTMLVPHLNRASLIFSKMSFQHARSTVQALESIGLPAVVLNADGRVIACSKTFDLVEGVAVAPINNRLRLANERAEAALQVALSQHFNARSRRGNQVAFSIPIPMTFDCPALVLHVIPLGRTASDIMNRGTTLVIFAVEGQTQVPPSAAVVQALYDLSPAEARLAVTLASGTNLKDAAMQCGIQFSTARSYLEVIFRKTDSNTQSQLVTKMKLFNPVFLLNGQ